MKKLLNRLLKKKRNIVILTIVLIALCVIIALIIKQKKANSQMIDMPQGGSVGMVTRGDISNELSSSGTLSPKNTYSITSLISGEIIEADFEEGDQVTAGQTLFVIDQSDISSDIESAERSYEKAKKDYDEAMSDKEKALAKLNNGLVPAGKTGYIKNLTLKAGDTVGKDTKIGEIYNNSMMSFRAAFLDTDAAQLAVGQDMFVEINDTGETIPGKIKAISDLTETLDGGIPVRYAEIYVSNPGGITDSDTANAYMGDIHSLSSGTFSAMKSEDLKLEITENVTVETVLVTEGQYVSSGTPLFKATADSVEEALKSINDSADNAEDSLKNAENQKTKLDETIDKYTITAPISGQVITKNLQVGEKVNNSSSSTAQLALIYDLSELTFQMSIDELDISNVKVGQDVKVTADAFEGKTFKGHVSNVGLNGTAQNGVTTYPVVVTMDEMEGLLPGMNVDGTIILESATDTLIIPSGALQRGNIVYVKDESHSDTAASHSNASVSSDTDIMDDADMSADMSANQFLGDAPDGYTAVKVTTGIISNDYVQILSGLSEGMEIYVKDTVSGDSDYFDMYMGGGPGGGGPDGGGHDGP